MLRVIPRADEQTILNVLDRLPEPSSITANMFGALIEVTNFSTTDVDFSFNGHFKISLKKPSKEKIKTLLRPEGNYDLPRTDFEEASFKIESKEIRITLSMYKLEIKYDLWSDTEFVFELLKGLDTSQLEVIITKHLPY